MFNLKETITFLGLSYKKEILKILLINVIVIGFVIGAYFLFDQMYIFMMVAIGGIFLDYFFISSYSNKKASLLEERESEFVSIISYFKIFISNKNNVYHSFECLIPYSSEWMSNEISNFLHEIDMDKSVKPFVNFASNFNSPTIENVMMSIYQMIDEGESTNRLTQFTFTFEQFSKQHKDNLIDKKQKSLDIMNTFPLIGAGGATLVLMFSILTVIGDLSNVI